MGNIIITVIVLAVIALVAVIAFRSYRKTLAQGCCGAGGGTIESTEEEKVLEGPVIAEKRIRIDGMTCINCQKRIEKRLNKIEGLSAKVDWKQGLAVVSMDREIPDNTIRMAILQLDYQVISIE